MASYKLYRIDGNGQIAGAPELIEASDDEEALKALQGRRKQDRFEMWQGRRLVARIGS